MKKIIRWLMIPVAVAIGMGIASLLGRCRLPFLIIVIISLTGCAHTHTELFNNYHQISNPYVQVQGRYDSTQELPQKVIVGTIRPWVRDDKASPDK